MGAYEVGLVVGRILPLIIFGWIGYKIGKKKYEDMKEDSIQKDKENNKPN